MNKQIAVCILITRTEKYNTEILAVSRKDNKKYFGLPGGKIEINEEEISAAKRELKEETGIDAWLENFKLIFEHEEENCLTKTFLVTNYCGLPYSQTGEGIVKWVSAETLINGSFGAYNKKLLQHMKLYEE